MEDLRIWVFSDLHLEFERHERPPTEFGIADADVCVIAGDVTRPLANSVAWVAEHVAPHMPVVMVMGNHEAYSNSIEEGLEDGLALAARIPGVHLLENSSAVVGGVRFLGCTMWTDYGLYRDRRTAMANALVGMNDHRWILRSRNPATRFLPEDALEIHEASRAWLEGALAEHFEGPTVVVTHHCPHWGSISPRFAGDRLNPAFTSDLSGIMEAHRPPLWIHGHTHAGCDYVAGPTRVVCNPVGYLGENEAFDRAKVVRLPLAAAGRDAA